MIERDVKAFWEADAAEHMGFAYQYGVNPDVRYPMYEIRRDLVFEVLEKRPSGRLLDAGCGAGHIINDAIKRGWDAVGFDFSEPMIALAHKFLSENGHDPGRATVGNAADLSQYQDASFDVVTLLGVSQYLKPEDDQKTWSEVHRVLKPGGCVIIDFVNALFDLSTFNRFTIRFVMDEFVSHFADQERIPDLERRISALVTHPQKPDVTGPYATRRDHVTKRTENPLTVAQRMKEFDFGLSDTLFYRFHAVPPLLFEQEPELEKIAIASEGKLARHWIGHFVASAFIAVLNKA
jgi:ubiquinone/menaquinone biosynthesis C-methylase UbiE